jgi:hypothetical protein
VCGALGVIGLSGRIFKQHITNEYLILRYGMFDGTITEDELTNKIFYEGGNKRKNKQSGPVIN